MNSKDQNQKFIYNPFSRIESNDLEEVIVPNFNLDIIHHFLESDLSKHCQFLGRKGRGKTTHLKWVAKNIPQYPLYLLNANSDLNEVMAEPSDILFIDSIHHLSFKNRVTLFRRKKHVLFTTHWSRRLECTMANRSLMTIRFKGVNSENLKALLNKRLDYLSTAPLKPEDYVHTVEVDQLIRKYKDDYRGIMNHMYDKYNHGE